MKRQINFQWARTENRRHIPVRITTTARCRLGSEPYSYDSTQVSSEEVVRYDGEFIVELDIDAICRRLAISAAFSKNGRSTCLSGLIKAKKLSEREISREKKDYPLGENAISREYTPAEKEALKL